MKYKCPMGCEGPKTYPAPGKCPVCGMNLVAVKEQSRAFRTLRRHDRGSGKR